MPITSSLSLPSPSERHLPELWSCQEIFSGRITFINLGRVSVGLLTARDGTFRSVGLAVAALRKPPFIAQPEDDMCP
jgi:hypothetical protein